MTIQEVAQAPVPAGKFRVIEQQVKSRIETSLGTFDSFHDAHACIEKTFKNRDAGWYLYSIYNKAGERIFIATSTKRKIHVFGLIPVTKTTFVSETYSFR